MMRLLGVAAVIFAVYWFVYRGGCGTAGAIACPDPALEQGLGASLSSTEVCPPAGYLCTGRASFRVARWSLKKGKLRVRVPLPDFVDAGAAREIREAAIEGIKAWDGHPFPIVVDTGKYTLRFPDITVVWSQGFAFHGTAEGMVNQRVTIDGQKFEYSADSLAVVVPPIAGGPMPDLANADPATIMTQLKAMVAGEEMGPAYLARIRAIAMHEMGHALGLAHSDSRGDIMFPERARDPTGARLSNRDLATVDTLYTLPNGAMVE